MDYGRTMDHGTDLGLRTSDLWTTGRTVDFGLRTLD